MSSGPLYLLGETRLLLSWISEALGHKLAYKPQGRQATGVVELRDDDSKVLFLC